VAVPLSSFETSMSEVQRVRLSRSNCYPSAKTKKTPRAIVKKGKERGLFWGEVVP
jgi:hypothetical protein